MLRADDGRWSLRGIVTSPLPAALILLAVYALFAVLNSPGGYLGTDTGAKVATLDAMVEHDTLRPDVGYWAEEWDPEGEYHPLFDTRKNDADQWINVTTLPMLIAAVPLYDVGGYRLALLWPMLGGVLAAFACRDVARQLAGDREGWWAFWVTGLASPIAVYSLDLWEHSLGAGLMVGAFALLLRTVRGASAWWMPLLAGLAFGASATMRAETFVVAFVCVGATCLTLLLRRRVVTSITTGAIAVAGFAVPWLANAALESELGGNPRTSRVSGQAQREWWTELGERSEEALITWFALPVTSYPGSVVFGAVVVVAILVAALMLQRGEDRLARLVLAMGAVVYLLTFLSGFGFVSGALVASPFAVAAVLQRRWDADRAFVLAVALAATALTWTFQLTGGAGPQWGGRYLLAPTLLLTTLGIVALTQWPAALRTAVSGFAVAVTLFGLLWLNDRSHGVDDVFEDLAERPEDVIVSTNGFLVREAGAAYQERRYLSLGRSADLEGAVDIVEDAGLDTFAVLTFRDEPADLDHAEFESTDDISFLGVPLWLHSYRIEPAPMS